MDKGNKGKVIDMMTSKEFVEIVKRIATDYKTLYIMGCFGGAMHDKNKERYSNNDKYNKQPERTKMIQSASADTFGFDCVGLIKGVLWGWNGNLEKNYGGARYEANDVPDIGANAMIKKCTNVSTDFVKVEIGEVVWKDGHIGVYIGGGLAVECTPSWENKVQITSCNCDIDGYNRRNWTKHGKLPYVEYPKENELKVGDAVKLTPDAVHYTWGWKLPSAAYEKTMYVRTINGKKITVSTHKEPAITAPVDISHIITE